MTSNVYQYIKQPKDSCVVLVINILDEDSLIVPSKEALGVPAPTENYLEFWGSWYWWLWLNDECTFWYRFLFFWTKKVRLELQE